MSIVVKIGNVAIGGGNPVLVQTMSTLRPSCIEKATMEATELKNCGCDILRYAVLDENDAKSFREIKRKVDIPLVADIHYDYKLARTSVTPGRTRLINYFDFGCFVLADLPGYGFAKVTKEEKMKWGKLMEDFFAKAKISLLISLLDIRHDPTKDDKQLFEYLYHYRIPFIVVATKADKLPKTRIKPQLQNLATTVGLGIGNITASSVQTGMGKEEIFKIIEKTVDMFGEG